MNNLKLPPDPSNASSYQQWKKDILLWAKLTDVPKNRQGVALQFATQKDPQVHETLCNLDSAQVETDTGLQTVINALDTIYITDKTEAGYSAYEQFESAKRQDNESIPDFVNRFQTLLNRVNAQGARMTDDIAAFRLLKSCNLTNTQNQLVRASSASFTVNDITKTLKKIFGNSLINNDSDSFSLTRTDIKTEAVNQASHLNIESSPYNTNNPNTSFTNHYQIPSHEFPPENPYNQTCSQPYPQACAPVEPLDHIEHFDGQHIPKEQDTLYTRSQHSGYNRFPIRIPMLNRPFTNSTRGNFYNNVRGNNRNTRMPRTRNPPDSTGKTSRCSICDSIMHWANQCPHKEETFLQTDETYYQVVLFQNDIENPESLPTLLHESLNSAVLDCGASSTCGGRLWFNCYIDSLKDDERKLVTRRPSEKKFRFGDGDIVESSEIARIPITLGSNKVFLDMDIVDKDIPLLLSMKSMKKCRAKLDMEHDVVEMFGEKIQLICTTTGHYAVPITSQRNVLNSIENKPNMKVILLSTNPNQDRKNMAKKIHRQFAHPPPERLIKLIDKSDLANDLELKEQIHKVSQSCDVCLRYKRPPPRPCVGLPLAYTFNECLALDIKFYKGTPILHMIDVCTRFSLSSIIENKSANTIVEEIFQKWITIFGPPEKFQSDNGTEFANETFRSMCEALGSKAMTSAAEAPFSNGLVERYNYVLSEMIDKILYDTNCSLSIAVAWANNAKNSLQTVHGFSPSQLVLGYNPRLPSIHTDKPPALSAERYPEIIENHLKAIRKGREAFIQAQNSAKIRRALNSKIRTASERKFVTGDSVYYKRANSRMWHGPAKVIGQEGQIVLVKNQSTWVRVHPCRLIHCSDAEEQLEDASPNNLTQKNANIVSKALPSSHNHLDPVRETIPFVIPQEETLPPEHPIPIAEFEPPVPAAELEPPIFPPEAVPHTHIPEEIPPNPLPTTIEEAEEDPELMENTELPQILKKGLNVEFKYKNDDKDEWIQARLISRSGKVNKNKHKNKYPNEWNVQTERGIFPLDFDREVTEFRQLYVPESTTEEVLLNTYSEEMKRQTAEAKQRELEMWKNQQVYEEVENRNYKTVNLKWVTKPKIVNGEHTVKCRLVAKGYEDLENVRKDSPCCSKDAIRITIFIIATKKWKLKSFDVKGAFLQGAPIEREIYVQPPKEAGTTNVWRLKKTIYGLRDASRRWYVKIREELVKVGCQNSLDQGLFFYTENNMLQGIIALYVDDLLTGGTALFYKKVMDTISQIFIMGSSHEEVLKYTGINVIQQADRSILVDQQTYICSLKPIEISNTSSTSTQSDEVTHHEYRSLVGSLNWLATVSRPDIAFDTCQLSTKVAKPTHQDILDLNKVIKYLKSHHSLLKFPNFTSLSSLSLVVFSDAAYANLPRGYSQGGYIVFITDGENSCPLTWSSIKLKRVVRSTLAAELLAFLEGYEAAFYIRSIMLPIISSTMNIIAVTDCKSLFDAAQTSNTIDDKMLRVEIGCIRELVDNNEVSLVWADSKSQLADKLTKTGVSPFPLLKALAEGILTQC